MVIDTDGSAFITKAEFDSLKNNFQAQIDSYNSSIDSKIDGAIAAYLSGIKLSNVSLLNILVGDENKYAIYGQDDLPPLNTSNNHFGKWITNTNFFMNLIVGQNSTMADLRLSNNNGWNYDAANQMPWYCTNANLYDTFDCEIGKQNLAWTYYGLAPDGNKCLYLDKLANVNTITVTQAGGVRPKYCIAFGPLMANSDAYIYDDQHGAKYSVWVHDGPTTLNAGSTSATVYTRTEGSFGLLYTVDEVIPSYTTTKESNSKLTYSWERYVENQFIYDSLFYANFNLVCNKWSGVSDNIIVEYGAGDTQKIAWAELWKQGTYIGCTPYHNIYLAISAAMHPVKCSVVSRANSTLYNEKLTNIVGSLLRTTDGIPITKVDRPGLLEFELKCTPINKTANGEISISDGVFGQNGLTAGNKVLLSLNEDMSNGTTLLTVPMNTWTKVYAKFNDKPNDILFFQGHCKTTGNYGAIFEFRNAKLTTDN